MFCSGDTTFVQDVSGALWMFGYDITRPEASLFIGATKVSWNGTRILQMSASYREAFLLDCHYKVWALEYRKDGMEDVRFKLLLNLPQIQQVKTSNAFTALLDFDGRIWVDRSFKEKLGGFSTKISRWISSLVTPKCSLDGFRLYGGHLPSISCLSLSPYCMLCGSENGEIYQFINMHGYCDEVGFKKVKLSIPIPTCPVRAMHTSEYKHYIVDGEGSVWESDFRRPHRFHKLPNLPKILDVVGGETFVLLLDIEHYVWAKPTIPSKVSQVANVFQHIQPNSYCGPNDFTKDPMQRYVMKISSGNNVAVGVLDDGSMWISGYAHLCGVTPTNYDTSSFIPLAEHPLRPYVVQSLSPKSARSCVPL